MKFLLDTSICITHLRSRSQSPLAARLNASNIDEIAICSIVRGELLAGAHHKRAPSGEMQRVHDFIRIFQSLPFDDPAADHFAVARAKLESTGGMIGANDLLIASIALANGLIVITHNRHEFSRIDGLQVQDWQASP
ncbi:type II toxin-antitoxin system VapC family toxin [soil metagenome]